MVNYRSRTRERAAGRVARRLPSPGKGALADQLRCLTVWRRQARRMDQAAPQGLGVPTSRDRRPWSDYELSIARISSTTVRVAGSGRMSSSVFKDLLQL